MCKLSKRNKVINSYVQLDQAMAAMTSMLMLSERQDPVMGSISQQGGIEKQ